MSSIQARAPRLARAVVLCCLVSASTLSSCARASRPTVVAATFAQSAPSHSASASEVSPTFSALRLAPEIQCAPAAQRAARAVASRAGDSAVRRAAQRGLSYVSQDAVRWQQQHNCYGCHVQAVTLEAMSVGRSHQYEVSDDALQTVLRGMLAIPGGHRQPAGLGVGASASTPATSNTFGGAAFARFDVLVDGRVREDLLGVAAKLQTFQSEDGSVRADDTRFPVVAGSMQATTQALQTWRVVYDRTADARWLEPMRRAEVWLQRRAREIADNPRTNITEINYAVFGLIAAGAMPSEPVLQSLGHRLRMRQREDGGWGFVAEAASEGRASNSTAEVQPNVNENLPLNLVVTPPSRARLHASVDERAGGIESSPFATGQTLYALRLLGAVDSDRAVQRGMSFLMERQQPDGGWSHSGAGRAEAMWAVFGLVSVDMLSLELNGVRDGQHAEGTLSLEGRASDNGGEGVAKVEIVVDDVPVARACGEHARWSLDTRQLAAGVHSVDVVATNVRGQQSRRRVEFYTGTHYLTQLAARYEAGTTRMTWRSVAPASVRGDIRVRVFSTRVEEGRVVRDREVWRAIVPRVEGAMSAPWSGHDQRNNPLPEGRYVAEVSFVAVDGREVHRQELLFAHESPESQARRYAEVQGTLALPTAGNAANTEVELVDEAGRVVQRTTTTSQGSYRFSNVDTGSYRVRVRRAGFRDAETSVSASAPGSPTHRAPAQADLRLVY